MPYAQPVSAGRWRVRVTGQCFRDSFAQGTVPALEPEPSSLRGVLATGGAPQARWKPPLLPASRPVGPRPLVPPRAQPPQGCQAGAPSQPRYLGHGQRPLAGLSISGHLGRTPLCKAGRRPPEPLVAPLGFGAVVGVCGDERGLEGEGAARSHQGADACSRPTAARVPGLPRGARGR